MRLYRSNDRGSRTPAAVKLDKLTKRLSRDLAANPKKAGILGVMVLVALYFWLPLLKEWIGDSATSGPAKVASVILTDDPATPAAGASKAKETLRWEKVRQWVESDPWMASATFDPQWRDPFAISSLTDPAQTTPKSTTPTTPEAIAAQAAASDGDISPEQAGLSVASVVVGPRLRTVNIGGDVYRENDLVEATAKDGETLEFQIVSITPHEVWMRRNGKTYRLQLSRPRLAKGDRIDRGSSSNP